MCGKDSLNGQQKRPLGLCCSYSGYCGVSSHCIGKWDKLNVPQTTELYCQNLDPVNLSKPCQEGYGNCRIVAPPLCGDAVSATPTASKGRKVAYYQAG